MKYKNCKHCENSNNYCHCEKTDCYENSYKQHLRRKYKLSDDCEILIKQGYVAKDDLTPQKIKLTQRGKLLETQFRIHKLIYDEIENEISKIYDIIERAKEDIEILEIQNGSYEMSENLLQIEVESAIENIFYDLSRSIHKISKKTYQKVYETLIESRTGKSGNALELPADDLIEGELYDKINAWLKNFKEWLFDNINTAFNDSFLETKSYVQKGLFDEAFEKVKDVLSKVKGKIETMIRNTILNAQTAAQKIAFKVQRVESYEVVLSDHPKTCEKCREMADKSKGSPINISDLKIGETAPPLFRKSIHTTPMLAMAK